MRQGGWPLEGLQHIADEAWAKSRAMRLTAGESSWMKPVRSWVDWYCSR